MVTGGNDCRIIVWDLRTLVDAAEARSDDPLFQGIWGAEFLDADTALLSDVSGYLYAVHVITRSLEWELRAFESDANLIQLATSADGRLAAVTAGYFPGQPDIPGEVAFVDLQAGAIISRHTLPHGIFYSQSSFSPDGRLLAIGTYQGAMVVDTNTGMMVEHLEHSASNKSTAFSPDGKWLICAASDGRTLVYDTASFERRIVETDKFYTGCVAIAPDSSMFATGGFDNQIKLFSLPDLKLKLSFEPQEFYLTRLRFNSDGSRLASSSNDGKVRIWDVATAEMLVDFDVPNGWYPNFDFSPDDTTLLLGSGFDWQIHGGREVHDLRRLTVAELAEVEISCRFDGAIWKRMGNKE